MRIIPILKIVTDKKCIFCVPFIFFSPKNENFIREASEISKMTRGWGIGSVFFFGIPISLTYSFGLIFSIL